MLTIAVLTVLVSGLAARTACHSIEVGLAVSGTLSSWLSCVEFLLLKQCNQRWCLFVRDAKQSWEGSSSVLSARCMSGTKMDSSTPSVQSQSTTECPTYGVNHALLMHTC